MRVLLRLLPAVIATVLLLIVAIGAVALAGSPNLKLPLDPWRGLSDPNREAQVQSAYDLQAKFIRDFNASGQDPRSLHREASQSFYGGPDSLGGALGASDFVVLATVRNVTFEPIAGQWLGQARVTIDVLRNLKGQAGPTLELIQAGSPAPTPDGHGVLQEFDVAPVLMPGDRVILMLARVDSGALTPLPGAGIAYLEAGLVRTLDRSALQSLLSGQTETEALDLYSAGLTGIK